MLHRTQLTSRLSATWLFLPLLILAEPGIDSPVTAEDYLSRGEKRAGDHHFDAAIADYNQALRLKPDDAEAFNDRGHSYYWTGEYGKAIADFTRAIELRPVYPNAFNNRGAAYMASGGGRERAIADFDRTIQLKPDYRYAYVNRANALGLRHWRLALDDFHRAGMHPEKALWAAGDAGLIVLAAGWLWIGTRRRR